MLGYRKRVKRYSREERLCNERIYGVCKEKVVSGVACHDGVGAFYVLLLSGVNKDHFGTCFSFLIDS